MLSFSPQLCLLLSFRVFCALVGSTDGFLCYIIYGVVFMLLKQPQLYCAEARDASGEMYSTFHRAVRHYHHCLGTVFTSF